MAALPNDNLSDLRPQNQREWFQYFQAQLADIKDSAAEDRDTILKIAASQSTLLEKMESRVTLLESDGRVTKEAVDTLKVQVRNWNVVNSLGVILAGILAALGLKGS